MLHDKKAEELFLTGFNCSQAVFAAFSDMSGIDTETALAVSSSFGGGIGRLRGICGAVSGMLMAAGAIYKPDISETNEHYERVRELVKRFECEFSSSVCSDLLKAAGLEVTIGGTRAPRTEAFYKERPCMRFVIGAARILDEYMNEHMPVHMTAAEHENEQFPVK